MLRKNNLYAPMQDGLPIRPANQTYFEQGVNMQKKFLLAVMIVATPLGWPIAVSPSMAQAQQADATSAPQASPVLPRPEAPFGGRISRRAKDSTPDFPREVAAPRRSQRPRHPDG